MISSSYRLQKRSFFAIFRTNCFIKSVKIYTEFNMSVFGIFAVTYR